MDKTIKERNWIIRLHDNGIDITLKKYKRTVNLSYADIKELYIKEASIFKKGYLLILTSKRDEDDKSNYLLDFGYINDELLSKVESKIREKAQDAIIREKPLNKNEISFMKIIKVKEKGNPQSKILLFKTESGMLCILVF